MIQLVGRPQPWYRDPRDLAIASCGTLYHDINSYCEEYQRTWAVLVDHQFPNPQNTIVHHQCFQNHRCHHHYRQHLELKMQQPARAAGSRGVGVAPSRIVDIAADAASTPRAGAHPDLAVLRGLRARSHLCVRPTDRTSDPTCARCCPARPACAVAAAFGRALRVGGCDGGAGQPSGGGCREKSLALRSYYLFAYLDYASCSRVDCLEFQNKDLTRGWLNAAVAAA